MADTLDLEQPAVDGLPSKLKFEPVDASGNPLPKKLRLEPVDASGKPLPKKLKFTPVNAKGESLLPQDNPELKPVFELANTQLTGETDPRADKVWKARGQLQAMGLWRTLPSAGKTSPDDVGTPGPDTMSRIGGAPGLREFRKSSQPEQTDPVLAKEIAEATFHAGLAGQAEAGIAQNAFGGALLRGAAAAAKALGAKEYGTMLENKLQTANYLPTRGFLDEFVRSTYQMAPDLPIIAALPVADVGEVGRVSQGAELGAKLAASHQIANLLAGRDVNLEDIPNTLGAFGLTGAIPHVAGRLGKMVNPALQAAGFDLVNAAEKGRLPNREDLARYPVDVLTFGLFNALHGAEPTARKAAKALADRLPFDSKLGMYLDLFGQGSGGVDPFGQDTAYQYPKRNPETGEVINGPNGQPVMEQARGSVMGEQLRYGLVGVGMEEKQADKVIDRMSRLISLGRTQQARQFYEAARLAAYLKANPAQREASKETPGSPPSSPSPPGGPPATAGTPAGSPVKPLAEERVNWEDTTGPQYVAADQLASLRIPRGQRLTKTADGGAVIYDPKAHTPEQVKTEVEKHPAPPAQPIEEKPPANTEEPVAAEETIDFGGGEAAPVETEQTSDVAKPTVLQDTPDISRTPASTELAKPEENIPQNIPRPEANVTEQESLKEWQLSPGERRTVVSISGGGKQRPALEIHVGRRTDGTYGASGQWNTKNAGMGTPAQQGFATAEEAVRNFIEHARASLPKNPGTPAEAKQVAAITKELDRVESGLGEKSEASASPVGDVLTKSYEPVSHEEAVEDLTQDEQSPTEQQIQAWMRRKNEWEAVGEEFNQIEDALKRQKKPTKAYLDRYEALGRRIAEIESEITGDADETPVQKSITPADAVHEGRRVKLPKTANAVTAIRKGGGVARVLATDIDTLKDGGPYKTVKPVKVPMDTKGRPQWDKAQVVAGAITVAEAKPKGQLELPMASRRGGDETGDDRFARLVDEHFAGRGDRNLPIRVGETPKVLTAVGATQLPMIIRPPVLDKIRQKHQVPIEDIKRLPELLRDPVAIFDSDSRPGALVVITDITTPKGPVIAAVHLQMGVHMYHVNEVASLYPRDEAHLQRWVDEGRLRYINKQKSLTLGASAGLHIAPEVNPSQSGHGRKVLTEKDVVKPGAEKPKPSYAGTRSLKNLDAKERTGLTDNLKVAQAMARKEGLEAGWRMDSNTRAANEHIRLATGWFKGLDGKWRYEVDDSGMKLKPGWDKAATIGEAIDHPELFQSYPFLRQVKIGALVANPHDAPRPSGSYDPGFDGIWAGGPDEFSLKETILHELQHAIQEREGFAKGGVPTSTADAMDVAMASIQARIDKGVGASSDPADLKRIKDTRDQFFNRKEYKRLGGEMESRDAADRMILTKDQREIIPVMSLPLDQEHIRPEDAILITKAGGNTGDTRMKREVAGVERSTVDSVAKATAEKLGQAVEVMSRAEAEKYFEEHPEYWKSVGDFDLDGVEAFYDPTNGKVILIHDQIVPEGIETPEQAVVRTVLHEMLAHKGLAALREADPEFGQEFQLLARKFIPREEMGRLADKYYRDYRDWRTNRDSFNRLAEEWFAREAEAHGDRPFVKRLVDAIVRMLRRVFPDAFKDWKSPEKWVADLLRRSREALRTSETDGTSDVERPMASRREGAEKPEVFLRYDSTTDKYVAVVQDKSGKVLHETEGFGDADAAEGAADKWIDDNSGEPPKPPVDTTTAGSQQEPDPQTPGELADTVRRKTPGLEILSEIKQGIGSLLLPTTNSKEHLEAAEILGSKLGAMHRRAEASEAQLRPWEKKFNRLGLDRADINPSDNDGIKFMSAMSTGKPVAPEFRGAMTVVEREFDKRIDLLEKAGAPLESVRENYFPGIWTKESRLAFNAAMEKAVKEGLIPANLDPNASTPEQRAKVKKLVDQMLADGTGSDVDKLAFFTRRPLRGKESFRKGKVFEDIMTAAEFGLRPVSYNPLELVKLKLAEMDRSIMAHEFFQELKAKKKMEVIDPHHKVPDGWVKVNDRYGTIYGPPAVTVNEYVDKAVYDGLMSVADKLGIKHDRATSIGGTRLGYSEQGASHVVTKFATETSVLAHEIGHQLDHKYNLWTKLTGGYPGAGSKRGYPQDELRAIADVLVKQRGREGYTHKKEEKIAQMIEAYVHAPERMQEVAPRLFKWFDDFVKSKPELKEMAEIRPGLEIKAMSADKYVGLPIIGYRIVPNEVGDIVNNYLSSSLYNNRYFRHLYKGWMASASALNQSQLGLGSAFHAGFTTAEVQVSAGASVLKDLYGVVRGSRDAVDLAKTAGRWTAATVRTQRTGDKVLDAWRNPEDAVDPKLRQIVRAAELAGGGFKMEAGLMTQQTDKLVRDWHSGNRLKAAGRSPVALTELLAKPIMDWLVPRQKAGVFAELAGRIIEQNPGKSLEDLRPQFRQAWNRVDARLGQVRYDRLFANNAAKNIVQALVRAPGWSGGTIAELGGAFPDAAKFLRDWARDGKPPAELPDRVAYTLSLLITVGVLNALLTYLFTGQHPKGLDFIAFRDGGQDEEGRPTRLLLPTYLKDILAYMKHPLGTVMSKAHPLVAMIDELKHNRDYYGTEIREPGAPLYKQAGEVGEYVAKSFVPFWIRGAQKIGDEGGGLSKKAAAYFGVMPAPRSITATKAEETLSEILTARRSVGGMTREQAARAKARTEIRRGVQRGDAGAIERGLEAGRINERDAARLEREAGQTYLQRGIYSLPVEDAMRVWRVATPEEKGKLRELLLAKIDRSETVGEDQKEALSKEVESSAP